MRITLRLPPPPYVKRGVPTSTALTALREGSEAAAGALHAAAAAAARGLSCSRRREETAMEALRRGLDALRNAVAFYDEGGAGGRRRGGEGSHVHSHGTYMLALRLKVKCISRCNGGER